MAHVRFPCVRIVLPDGSAGVSAQHVANRTLRDVEIAWGDRRQPYWGHAMEAHDVQRLLLRGFGGGAGREGPADRQVN